MIQPIQKRLSWSLLGLQGVYLRLESIGLHLLVYLLLLLDNQSVLPLLFVLLEPVEGSLFKLLVRNLSSLQRAFELEHDLLLQLDRGVEIGGVVDLLIR